MSRWSLDSYVRAFEAEQGGRLKMTFFGEDVNEFTREELLALVYWFANETARLKDDNDRNKRFIGSII